MKYSKPTYEKENVETNDIILASLGSYAIISEKDKSSAEVSVSVYSILGLR